MTDSQERNSPAQGAPAQPGPGQPYNPMPPPGWGNNPGYGASPPPASNPGYGASPPPGSNPGYGALPPPASNPGYGVWPPPGGKPSSNAFGPAWQAGMAKGARRSIRNLIVMGVFFLVAIGFVIFAGVANNFDQVKGLLGMSSTGASPTNGSSEQAANLKVGDCLGSDPNGRVSTVNIVSCTTPHAAEVVAVLTMPDGPYPAQSVIDDYKNKCEDALNTYDPQSGPDNSIELTTLTPLQFDWSTGDHTMDCVASLSPPRTGSIKG